MTAPTQPNTSRADCSRCAALCCIMFAFENTEDFAVDKPAGTPCPHLSADRRCKIHDTRAEQGFGGCIKFDCHGAGQRVSQDVFGGRTWQDAPALTLPMLHAFETMRLVVDLEDLLVAANALPLKPDHAAKHADLEHALAAHTPWTQDSLAQLKASNLPDRIRAFAASLGEYVTHK